MGAKRRRTKMEKASDDLEAANKDNFIKAKLARITQLEAEVAAANEVAAQNTHAAEIINNLEEKGVIKIDDNLNVSINSAV
jgi:predicted transcriptional regulator YheO